MVSIQRIALVICSVLALTAGRILAQVQIHVPADHPTIQAAIDAAAGGDDILVAPGTYNEAINFDGKAVHLRSSDGPLVTIIDGSGLGTSVVRCVSGEGPGTILEGFTITGGEASHGGGMRNSHSSPIVRNCIFAGNAALNTGGGMYNSNSSPTVTNTLFIGNIAVDFDGGGMVNISGSSPIVEDCIFESNTGRFGGGMYNSGDSDATISNCTFDRNSASLGGGIYSTGSSPSVSDSIFVENTATSQGGGMYISTSGASVTNCTFERNVASTGGGIRSIGQFSVSNCTFTENHATNHGGGMHASGSGGTVANSAFQDNFAVLLGGAMFNLVASLTVSDSLFERNRSVSAGGGISNGSSNVDITRCVFIENASTGGGAINNVNSSPHVTDSLFLSNRAGGALGAAIRNTGSSSPIIVACRFEDSQSGYAIASFLEGAPAIGDSFFCENVPDHIFGAWTGLGNNDFRLQCIAAEPPIAVCNAYPTGDPSTSGSILHVECNSPQGREITLDASGSSDPDSLVLEYRWDVNNDSVVLADPDAAVTTGVFPIGVTTATLTVTNSEGAFATCDVTIHVQDTTPPEVLVTTDLAVLWPPNHTMRDVQVVITAADICMDPGFIFPIAATLRSNEPDNAAGNGDGDTTGDCNGHDGYTAPVDITSAFTWDPNWGNDGAWIAIIQLRAERAGSGKGRTYTIDVQAFDSHNNMGECSVVVVVPKGRGQGN